MTLQTVKLSQLRLSPLNVRRVKPKAIDQLAADMLAHGQLQNLVVYAEGNRFEVAAGGRRYRAFKQLEKAKAIPASHPVSVDVRDKADAVELSLAENVSREDMHVADAVIAYGDLHAEGKSPEDIRTKRIAKGGSGDAPAIKSDYSGAMIETLSKIKTLAVQEAVATNPALALDILLDCLVGQGIHSEPSYYSPLALRLEGFNAAVPDDMMTLAEVASVDEIGGGDFAAMPEVNRFTAIRAMDTDAKGRLLALLVARQINGGETSGSRRDRRHQRFDQIAFASGVDMVAKWQAPVAFYDRLKKPVIAKIMTEVLGKSAADNCAKMKKGELAAAAAERMAGRGWLPPALVIAEPPVEVAQDRAAFDDDGAEDDEAAEFKEEEAA